MLRRRSLRLVATTMVSTFLALSSSIGSAAPAPQSVPDQYIVVLKDNTPDPAQVANEHTRAHGLALGHVYQHALKGYAARISAQALGALRSDPRVLFISEDRIVQAVDHKPGHGSGATTSQPSQTLPTGINRIDADSSSTQAGDGSGSISIGVAIIDTGIDTSHPDLYVAGGKNCSDGRSYNDGNGHGTHVAGTVGARDNGIGVVGVAPGTPLYAVRVLNNAGTGSWSSVICGIDWVTANASRIKVANMSLGGGGSDDGNCGNTNSDALHKAICGSVRAGVTYVVAAGNSGADLRNFVPAAYNEVLAVTAIADYNGQPGGGAPSTCANYGADDSAASFSNYATLPEDQDHTIAAPGVCIRSTWKGGDYRTISGTSMASPHVAGAVALCMSSRGCSDLSPSQVVAKLRNDAASQPAGYGFVGDPNRPISGRYYGYLVYAGGY